MESKEFDNLVVDLSTVAHSVHVGTVPEPEGAQGSPTDPSMSVNQGKPLGYCYESINSSLGSIPSLYEPYSLQKKAKRTFAERPITDFSFEASSNEFFNYAVGEMQGWRARMEDAHLAQISFGEEHRKGHGFFCVFDGHSGKRCSQLCHDLFPRHALNSFEGETVDFEKMFIAVDADLRRLLDNDKSGCTAVAVHVSPTKITCASVGDSRAVLCRNGRAIPLSRDHKPELEEEWNRINAAGGFVYNNRVNGCLAMSRSMGDFMYKGRRDLLVTKQQVISVPEVVSLDRITVCDSFIVLACDGIFDVITNEDVIEITCNLKKEGKTNVEICNFFCNYCLAPQDQRTGFPSRQFGTDNMTIMIVDLNQKRVEPEIPQE